MSRGVPSGCRIEPAGPCRPRWAGTTSAGPSRTRTGRSGSSPAHNQHNVSTAIDPVNVNKLRLTWDDCTCGLLASLRSPLLPPKTNIFQKGTANTATAVWYQRGGPAHKHPMETNQAQYGETSDTEAEVLSIGTPSNPGSTLPHKVLG